MREFLPPESYNKLTDSEKAIYNMINLNYLTNNSFHNHNFQVKVSFFNRHIN